MVLNMPAKGWGSVSLPDEIISDIDNFLEKPPKKYSSRNEFVRHAVFNHLLREGFYVRREEYHLTEDELASRGIQKKKDQSNKTDLDDCTKRAAVEG